jgi:hypothetical protein
MPSGALILSLMQFQTEGVHSRARLPRASNGKAPVFSRGQLAYAPLQVDVELTVNLKLFFHFKWK